jgi:hypothetical protein
MSLSAEVLAEEPEESMNRLQRQRTTRITMAVVALVAVFAITGISVTLAYQNGPEAAAASPANHASP